MNSGTWRTRDRKGIVESERPYESERSRRKRIQSEPRGLKMEIEGRRDSSTGRRVCILGFNHSGDEILGAQAWQSAPLPGTTPFLRTHRHEFVANASAFPRNLQQAKVTPEGRRLHRGLRLVSRLQEFYSFNTGLKEFGSCFENCLRELDSKRIDLIFFLCYSSVGRFP